MAHYDEERDEDVQRTLMEFALIEKKRKFMDYQLKNKRIKSCNYSEDEKNILFLLLRAEYDGII